MDKFEWRRLKLVELMNERCNGRVTELAKRLERSESYVTRMLYAEGKAHKKKIGEEMADLIAQKFGVDRAELELPDADAPQAAQLPELALQWVTPEESLLLSQFRSTDAEGRQSILAQAQVVKKVLLTGAIRNQS